MGPLLAFVVFKPLVTEMRRLVPSELTLKRRISIVLRFFFFSVPSKLLYFLGRF